ncbi:response regulator transcription factor [Poseidonibacter ostreae]|uniref:Response regulator n=1 Tax=Poseidonibacter ostreae TaxID=2654171 RepID=A0A6L4WUF3_9BACT|nr:response regulator transcription factor [Poseidonibacter ostreae]KAB7883126.1 response regulator [Poseidonibacter ostreae]KAB7889020.1 response regulator [Poseidonibacter ostreae]KAB7891953.1 response regulator [Poseidonibacter ostreae]
MKILLLEDDLMLSDILKEYLEVHFYSVFQVFTGNEANEMLYNQKFDLLLFDINVPEINGLNIFEKFKNLGFTIPIIFMTASTNFQEFEKAYRIGANDFLRKPFRLEELKIRIEYIEKNILMSSTELLKIDSKTSFHLINMYLIQNDRIITLPKKEAEIIKYFLLNKNRTISVEELVINIWEYASEPSIATIRTYIKNIRKKLNNLSTIKGLGYILKI